MNENSVEIASLVRQIVLDTLANSVMVKVRHALVPSAALASQPRSEGREES
jgi:hypothetical protein